MSTASQRRKAKRLALQAPFLEKVYEVARALPRRPPERVLGTEYIDRIESYPIFDEENAREGKQQTVWLKVPGGGRGELPPRTFVIPYGPRGGCRAMMFDAEEQSSEQFHNVIQFTWRSYLISAGDTRIRWLVPEVTGRGMDKEMQGPWYAARKAVSLAANAIVLFEAGGYPPRYTKEIVQQAREALLEWIGEVDSYETRAARDAEARSQDRSPLR